MLEHQDNFESTKFYSTTYSNNYFQQRQDVLKPLEWDKPLGIDPVLINGEHYQSTPTEALILTVADLEI